MFNSSKFPKGFASGIRVYKTLPMQVCPHLIPTRVEFDTIVYDVLNEWDLVNNMFTARQSGIYAVHCQIGFQCLVPNIFHAIWLMRNVATYDQTFQTESITVPRWIYPQVNTLLHLNAGETLIIRAQQTSGGNENLSAGEEYQQLTIQRLY